MLRPCFVAACIMLFTSLRSLAQYTDTVGRVAFGNLQSNPVIEAMSWNRIPSTFNTCSHDLDLQVRVVGRFKGWSVESSDTNVVKIINADVLHIIGSGTVVIT